MNFSQRMGLEPATKPLQTNSMDEELRNSLWNVFGQTFASTIAERWQFHGLKSREGLNRRLLVPLWADFFKEPLDTLPVYADSALDVLMGWYFQKTTPWNKVYQFIEFVGNLANDLSEVAEVFRHLCNRVLERECSAYRFVGTTIAPITSEEESRAIEVAASMEKNPLRLASTHIDTALKLLSDRTKPDYRNSMKEAISAVEAVCKLISQNDSATLGQTLSAVTARTSLHRDLRAALQSLYGYTNDDHGIRHALKDDAEPEAEDARFLLVTCSAFVNYLVKKARKNGLLPE